MTLSNLFGYLWADLLRISPSNSSLFFLILRLFHPRFLPVLLIRLARYLNCHRVLRFLSPIFTWLNVFIFGIEVTAKCDIGPGLMLPHTFGTVVGANKIGANATLFQGVTIGASSLDMYFERDTRPVLGCNVIVGAGAKVLGNIYVGDNVTIGANSVVIKSVSDGLLVAGVPAKILRKVDE